MLRAGLIGAACGLGRVWAAKESRPAHVPRGADGAVIPGFDAAPDDPKASKGWTPFSDRKIRVGIAGYGLCEFGAAFGFQHHPNVEVVAVTDLIPQRCAELAKACRCDKTYPSCEAMLADDRIEAVFIATDAPSHARLAIAALRAGKHVASAVPAVFGSIEEADRLFEAVQQSGLTYMMFETSCFHPDLYTWRQQYQAGKLGALIYSEGEYYHYCDTPLPGYNPRTKSVDPEGWRKGLPPQWYPTHANAYYIGVTGGSFTDVACVGMPSILAHLRPENNLYRNPFGTEVALYRTRDGGLARMAVSWDMATTEVEQGRIYGQKKAGPAGRIRKPLLPPGVAAGPHGGSHGFLMNEFVDALLRGRPPLVDIVQALNMTVPGLVAHQSALKGGEWMKIPQYARS